MAVVLKHYDQATVYSLQKWLETLYADEESCPQLNPAIHDIEHLLKLKARNEEAEKNTREIIKTNRNLTKSYNTKSEELEILLESENVNISEETMQQVESIAGLAMRLNLEVPDETNFLLAISDMKTNQIKKQLEKSKLSSTLESLSKKILKIQKQNESIEKESETLEKTVELQDFKQAKIKDLLNTTIKKIANYDNKSQIYEELLKDKKFDPSIRHSNLVKQDEEIKALEKEVKQLKRELDSYKSLPPNLCLAEFELTCKKEELSKIEAEFQVVLEFWENMKTQ